MDHIGLDVHQKGSQLCILSEAWELIERRVRPEPQRSATVQGESGPGLASSWKPPAPASGWRAASVSAPVSRRVKGGSALTCPRASASIRTLVVPPRRRPLRER